MGQNKYVSIRMRYSTYESRTVQIISENREIFVHLRNPDFCGIYPSTPWSPWLLDIGVAARSLDLLPVGSRVCGIIRHMWNWQTTNTYPAICPQNALHLLNVLHSKPSDVECWLPHFSMQQVRLDCVVSIVQYYVWDVAQHNCLQDSRIY